MTKVNRRAAITGALLSVGALAVPVSAAARPTTIEALAMKFRDDCMALDPTVTGAWIGFDEIMDGPREDRVQAIYLTRDHAPFVRKAPAAKPVHVEDDPSPTAIQWWNEFTKLPTDLKLEYARMIRETDPRFGELADRIEHYYGEAKHG